ncbi:MULTISPECIES: gephyrin-like molybdotransferase Glp [Pelosinus]|uniref:Molybdopterin molybdenumtransferase n=1 Tax=Pelosinus fermentans B4 TaxID=1149862 RepID=I9L824_9FIRM|nr:MULTISPECIES: gephyrin-like molybdotransferase Glp [Pelosinus]EIW16406.1 MoeA domain protein domain I and II [Pelosinus fermentans B4]EIW22613.1 molybdenum cofactor synthesis domain protein [Pelosinus fermentans A11]
MIVLEDALTLLLNHAPLPCSTTRYPLAECFGRILAEDITSTMDFPPFNRSPLDGYAVQLKDIVHVSPEHPVLLMQIESVPAGSVPCKIVTSGQATRIMTGAKIPEGADAVVRLEDTRLVNDQIEILTADKAATNICSQGEEIRINEKVLTTGTLLEEGALGLLSMLGQANPLVFHKPKIGILATGSELLSPSAPMKLGKIRDSNSYMLLAKTLKAGGEPVLLGHVEDNLSSIITKLSELPDLPVYITTGGASVGDYDLMEKLFQELQIPLLFKGVAMKPGMPVLAGVWKNSLLIALSGNPAAGSVSFEMLISPLIRKITGLRNWNHKKTIVKLCGTFTKTSPTRRFVWARWFMKQGFIFAEPLSHQGNGMLKSALEANALLEIPAHNSPIKDGTELEAILLHL